MDEGDNMSEDSLRERCRQLMVGGNQWTALRDRSVPTSVAAVCVDSIEPLAGSGQLEPIRPRVNRDLQEQLKNNLDEESIKNCVAHVLESAPWFCSKWIGGDNRITTLSVVKGLS